MAHQSEEINTRQHPFVGVRWPVTGSKGDEYRVTMYDSGFDCTCIAFRKCKHIKEVEDKILGKGIYEHSN
jgi:uncharacterized Zn finger protein